MGGVVGCLYAQEGDSSLTESTVSGAVSGNYSYYVGGLVGYAEATDGHSLTISDNHATGVVNGYEYSGGIVGYVYVENNETTLAINGNTATGPNNPYAYYVGGIVGYLRSNDSTVIDVSESHVVGDVVGYSDVGGVVGELDAYDGTPVVSIEDTHLSVDVTASSYSAGGLIGYMEVEAGNNAELSVTNSSSSGSITSGETVGGLIGGAYGYSDSDAKPIKITNSYATGDVTINDGSEAGGLIGEAEGVSIDKSYATGNVTGTDGSGYESGGLVGYVYNTDISKSFATGDVHVESSIVGGLVGYFEYGTVTDSYARGAVRGTDYIGGLVGYVDNDVTLNDVYATGELPTDLAEVYIGGLVAYIDDSENVTVTNSFWDRETTGTDYELVGTSKTTAQMHAVATYTDTSTEGLDTAWDLVDTWGLQSDSNDGYPCLRWYDEDCDGADGVIEDNDGIAAATENGAPNGGDANNDGIADAEQPYVASFANSVSGHYTTVSVPSSCTLHAVSAASESSNAARDSAYSYNTGLVNFNAACGSPGVAIDVVIYYHGLDSINGLVARKYNSATHGYATVGAAHSPAITKITIGGQPVVTLSYHIVDGDDLDTDGVANGTIVDPIGLGKQVVGIPNTGVAGRL